MRDRNHMAYGHANIRDQDLLGMYSLVSKLPWMEQVLQEIQYLRNGDEECEDCENYKAFLDDIGADYK